MKYIFFEAVATCIGVVMFMIGVCYFILDSATFNNLLIALGRLIRN